VKRFSFEDAISDYYWNSF